MTLLHKLFMDIHVIMRADNFYSFRILHIFIIRKFHSAAIFCIIIETIGDRIEI